MTIISGHIDMVLEEEEMLEFFIEFQTYFDIEDFMFTFEDKTKKGIACKPHYHFIGIFTHQRNTVAKWLGTHGKGYYSTHEVSDEEKAKAILYILKQQQVVFTDYDEKQLVLLLEESLDYNKNLSTKTGFKAHFMENIIPEMALERIKDRHNMVYYIAYYVQDWNKKHSDYPLMMPTPAQMLSYIQYYSSLHVKESVHAIVNDYQYIIGYDDNHKSEQRYTKFDDGKIDDFLDTL